MKEKADWHVCSQRVYNRGGWHSRACTKSGIVERVLKVVGTAMVYDENRFAFVPKLREVAELRWFCAQHDPERVAARAEAAEVERVKQREAADKRCAAARDLCVRLGCGHVHFSPNGVTGSIVLERDDVEKLLKELGR